MRRHLFDIKGARELGDGGTGNDIIKGSRATLTNLADELRPVMQDEGYAIILNNRELTHKSASYFHKIDPCCTFRLRSSTADSTLEFLPTSIFVLKICNLLPWANICEFSARPM